jgi:hypothetical protein
MLCSPHQRLHSARPKNVHRPIPMCVPVASRGAANRKNVLGPILDPPLSSKHSVDPKNVPGPIRAASCSQSHSVNLKNVHRPMRMLFCSSVTALPTGKMFLDLSWSQFCAWGTVYPKNVPGPIRSSLDSLDPHCNPRKCSWTYLELSLLLIAFSRP